MNTVYIYIYIHDIYDDLNTISSIASVSMYICATSCFGSRKHLPLHIFKSW